MLFDKTQKDLIRATMLETDRQTENMHREPQRGTNKDKCNSLRILINPERIVTVLPYVLLN